MNPSAGSSHEYPQARSFGKGGGKNVRYQPVSRYDSWTDGYPQGRSQGGRPPVLIEDFNTHARYTHFVSVRASEGQELEAEGDEPSEEASTEPKGKSWGKKAKKGQKGDKPRKFRQGVDFDHIGEHLPPPERAYCPRQPKNSHYLYCRGCGHTIYNYRLPECPWFCRCGADL